MDLFTTFETVYGVGAAVYHMDTADQKSSLDVEWLFVDSMFRNRGVANFLMGELLFRMSEVDVREMRFALLIFRRMKNVS